MLTMSTKEIKLFCPDFPNDKLFEPGEDGRSFRFTLMRQYLRDMGWGCSTYDDPFDNIHYSTIFVNIRKRDLPRVVLAPRPILLIYEPVMLRPANHSPVVRSLFTHVVGWSETHSHFLGPGTYIPNDFKNICLNNKRHNKIALICSNRSHAECKTELYSYRRNIVDYYLTNDPNFLHLYGRGWSSYDSLVSNSRSISTIYKGAPTSKLKTLSSYMFSFAIENERSDSMYITEKILDAMISGCIPIYLGSTQVSKLIDPSLFIELSNFSSLAELGVYLRSLSPEEIARKRYLIYEFLESTRADSSLFCYNWARKLASLSIT